eukprot:Nitzschia sp. Nitz4//scaffold6_size259037//69457//74478//NITZ4_001057-RA/size259037-processed-gene-0.8-mRNA-1//1//CDS//3329556842//3176//frame0
MPPTKDHFPAAALVPSMSKEFISAGKQADNKSYEDYLHDVAGGSFDEEVGALNKSDLSIHLAPRLSTPRTLPTGMVSPQLTEAPSFVNGLLSPFSPLLRQQDQRDEYLQYVSLQPCRKVSVVVRVLPCSDPDQRCLFPHLKNEYQSQPALINKPKSPRDMVVVNPSAFGKKIPVQVTMETARLVAQVAHIASEDWARLYEFHHVMWPKDLPLPPGSAPVPSQFSTIDSLARAVSQDALLEQQSSTVISMGQGPTCIDKSSEESLLSKVISHSLSLMETEIVGSLTMVEIPADKDTFRDLQHDANQEVALRHIDMNGALLEGLVHVPIDDTAAIQRSLSLRSRSPDSIVIATISFWEAVQEPKNDLTTISQITCVEMSSEGKHKVPANSATAHRRSVSLGLALRQLLLQSTTGTEPALSYRETSLNKVLQRPLESSKVVLVSSVSQRSQDYETTLSTLDYLRRLLVKPGSTALTPFGNEPNDRQEDMDPSSGPSTPNRLKDYASDRYLLENLVSDPRQRLAKVFNMSPVVAKPIPGSEPSVDETPSIEDDYHPIDYMQGLDSHPADDTAPIWQSPPAKTTPIRTSNPFNLPQPAAKDIDEWQPEDPPQDSFGDSHLHESTIPYSDTDSEAPDEENDGINEEIPEQDGEWPPIDPANDIPGADSSHNHEENRSWAPESELMSQAPLMEEPAPEEEIVFEPSNEMAPESDDESDLPEQPETPQSVKNPNTSQNPETNRSWYGWQEDDGDDDLNLQPSTQYDLPEASFDDSLNVKDQEVVPTIEPRLAADAPGDSIYGDPPSMSLRLDSDTSAFEPLLSTAKTLELDDTEEIPVEAIDGSQYKVEHTQNDMFESSSIAIQQLRTAMNEQRDDIARLISENEDLRSTIEDMKDSMQRTSNEHDTQLQQYEEEVQQVRNELSMAVTRKTELENEVANASSTRADLEHKLDEYENALNESSSKAASAADTYYTVLQSRDDLQAKVTELERRLGDLELERDTANKVRDDFEGSLAQANENRVLLELENNTKNLEIQDLHGKLAELERSLQQRDEKEKDLLSSVSSDRAEMSRLHDAFTQAEKKLKAANLEIDSLQNEKMQEQDLYQKLQIEFDSFKKRYLNEKQHYEEKEVRSQQNTMNLEKENAKLTSMVKQMKAECARLRDENNWGDSSKAYWEEQSRKLNQTIDDINMERTRLANVQKDNEVYINKLENELRLSQTVKEDVAELQEECRRLKSEKSTFESTIVKLKAEKQEESEKQASLILNLRNQIDENQERFEILQGRETERNARKDSEIKRLQKLLSDRTNSLDELTKNHSDLQKRLSTFEVRDKGLSREISMAEATLEKYKVEISELHQELALARERELAHASNNDLETQRLSARIRELENEVATRTQERDDALSRFKNDALAHKSLEAELHSAKEGLVRQKAEVNRISRDLDISESEKKRYEDRLSEMTKSLHRFQSDTKVRIEDMAVRHRSSISRVQRLESDNGILEERLERAIQERDACFKCLEVGREKLSYLIGRSGAIDLLGPIGHGNDIQEFRAKGDPESGMTGMTHVHYSRDALEHEFVCGRAQEIVACLALSAKKSLREREQETSNLRSQVYQLEEEKGVEVAALKTRIRNLEREVQQTTYRNGEPIYGENYGHRRKWDVATPY